MTNQKSVTWAVLNRWFDIIGKAHEGDDYELNDEHDYYDYICDLIRDKHCINCKTKIRGCNYCSIYAAIS